MPARRFFGLPGPLEREPQPQGFFGLYRGLVVENTDPLQIGRIMVQVPAVPGPAPSTRRTLTQS